jgi:Ca2+/Na+ antiporter
VTIVFYIVAALLVLVCALYLMLSVKRKPALQRVVEHKQANLAILREQLKEIERDKQGKGIDQKACQQQQGWSQPEQCSSGLEWRAIQDEVAIAVHHIRADLIRATALPQLLHDLMAQVHSQLGTRSCNRLVLAHQTTQLSSNFQHYRLLLPLRPRLGLGRGYEKPHAGS